MFASAAFRKDFLPRELSTTVLQLEFGSFSVHD